MTAAVIAGHWLDAVDSDGAVVNERALPMLATASVGDRIHLIVHDHAANLLIVGIVREHLTQGTVYTSSEEFGQIMAAPGLTEGVRVALQRSDEQSATETVAKIASALDRSGIKVANSISHAQLGRALGGHLFILIFTLVVMSVLMTVVGVMGLGSAMVINVIERTREFAVMRVVGARANSIRRSVIGEAVLVGVLSACTAFLWSIPLTIFVDRIVGVALFGPTLGTALSVMAPPLWLAIVIVGAVIASAYPAWRASKLSIRETLAYQ